MITVDYLLTSLIVVLIPGTGVIFTVSAGLFLGWRASVHAAIGCTAGIVPHLLASILGLAAVLHMSATAFQTLKFAGVAYLFYLAWATWRDQGMLRLDRPSDVTGRRLMLRSFLVNILNPKLSIFFLAFMPQFVPAQAESALAHLLLLSAVFMGMTFVVFIVYGVLASGVRRYVLESPRVLALMRNVFAAAFAGLGARLAFESR